MHLSKATRPSHHPRFNRRTNHPPPVQSTYRPPPPNPQTPTFDFEVVKVNAQGQIIQREQKSAEYYREDLGNGVFLDLVKIPGGRFRMGSPNSESDRYEDEGPQHGVQISGVWIGEYPVTQAQWRAVAALPKVERDLDADPANFKGDNRPVEKVSWDEAVEFCQRLSRHSGRDYRLPSEAEWEYACRAGTTTPFHLGETITTDLANYRGTAWEYEGKTYPGSYGQGPKGKFREETTNVGNFPANGFGLYDMHGNVWEWCADHRHDSYKDAPTNGRVWLSSDDSNLRLVRGGSWLFIPALCRSASRNWVARDIQTDNLGFRVVCASS